MTLAPDASGNRRRKTVYAPTEPELRRKMRTLRRQLDDAGDLSTSDPRLEQWLADWLDRIAGRKVKPSTLRSYRSAAKHHINPSIGRIFLSRLSVAHIRKMHADIVDRDLSTTTAHNAHRILAAALADAVREGRMHRNVASLVPAPTKAESDRMGMTPQAAKHLIRTAADSRWLFALTLGMRQGERLGLRWSHVDLDDGLIDLAWSLTRVSWAHGCPDPEGHTARVCPQRRLPIPAGMRWEPLAGNLVLMAPKTKGSRRVVPLLPVHIATLKAQREITGAHELVWCKPNGNPLDPRQDHADWKAALTQAGLPEITLHEARHTAASLLLEDGVDAKVIGQILGHSTVITTRGYQHASVDLSRAALAGLAKRLELESAAAS